MCFVMHGQPMSTFYLALPHNTGSSWPSFAFEYFVNKLGLNFLVQERTRNAKCYYIGDATVCRCNNNDEVV